MSDHWYSERSAVVTKGFRNRTRITENERIVAMYPLPQWLLSRITFYYRRDTFFVWVGQWITIKLTKPYLHVGIEYLPVQLPGDFECISG